MIHIDSNLIRFNHNESDSYKDHLKNIDELLKRMSDWIVSLLTLPLLGEQSIAVSICLFVCLCLGPLTSQQLQSIFHQIFRSTGLKCPSIYVHACMRTVHASVHPQKISSISMKFGT